MILKFTLVSFMQMFYCLINILVTMNKILIKNKLLSSNLVVLLVINLSGLEPYYWMLSCYFWSNFLVSFSFWFVLMMSLMLKNISWFLAMFLPLNCPKMLWVFMIILEIMSQIIRPVTLSLRLTCNLITGHVFLSLLSSSTLLTLLLIFILIFELMVSMIQASVFSLLLNMYKEETD